MERGKREEIYTYADLRELAARVGVFLFGHGVAANERVMLFAKNAPEWSMAYFGILKAGAHGGAGRPRVVGGGAGQHRARLRGGRHAHRRRAAREARGRAVAALGEAGLATKIWSFSEAFALPELAVEQERAATLVRRQSPTRWRR